MSEELDGQECPFKKTQCTSHCAAYHIRNDEDDTPYMVCVVLKAIGVDNV